MHAAHPVPAHVEHLVVILFAVHNGFGLDLAMGWLVAGILLDETAYNFAIPF
jgi:hypothetical protein